LGTFDRKRLRIFIQMPPSFFNNNHRQHGLRIGDVSAANAGALSYAVSGVAWPLSAVIRAMGAYFIRCRRSRGAL
jgi:glycerol-3-phosphate O-acyltransferase